MDLTPFVVLPPLGALLWRIRGGLLNGITGKANWLGFNDTVVRAIWSGGMAFAYWMLAPIAPLAGVVLAASLFAGTTVFGWMGAALYPTKLYDVVRLTESGLLRMTFTAAALLSPWPLLAGLLCGPTYWLAGKFAHPEAWEFWGEFAFGFVVGLILAINIVWFY